jgi:hypothetical protein
MATFRVHPATNGVVGLAGCVHRDYRAVVDPSKIETLGFYFERVALLLVDDVPKPEGAARKPTLTASVIAPKGLQNYGAYRVGLHRRIERGESLIDIVLV